MSSKFNTKFNSLSQIKSDSQLNLSQDWNDSLMPIQDFLHLPSNLSQSKPSSSQLFSVWRSYMGKNTRNFSTFERHQDWVDKRDSKLSKIKTEQDLAHMKECTFNPVFKSKPPSKKRPQMKAVVFPAPRAVNNLDTDEFKHKVFCTKKYTSISPYTVNVAFEAGCSRFK